MVKRNTSHSCWFDQFDPQNVGEHTISYRLPPLREVCWLKPFGNLRSCLSHHPLPEGKLACCAFCLYFHAIPHSWSSRVNFPKTRSFKEHQAPQLFPTSFRISTPAFSASSCNLLISGLTYTPSGTNHQRKGIGCYSIAYNVAIMVDDG